MTEEPVIIKTSQATLRPWRMDDAPSVAKYANNPKVAKNMRDGFPNPYSEEDAERFLTMATGDGPALLLAVEIDGEACGGIGVTPFTDVYRKTAEIGYWLAEPFWGRGVMTEVVKAVVPVAFGRFDIVRLQAGVYEGNLGSMRVLEKAGFEREAVHKKAIFKNGELLDEVVFVLFGV
ncbi:GCN5-related N-acetyltransferase [Methanolacinia petrolearia DSM 11571]|uniref:GCN5-related N-acetyltransferase n=1 Tax=Methanolacinia petrolearia (strain DSM 11571 / OCM 486 / SEBR 4847) TaxID=679926 RepID=E1REZ7_METP4|nr:GNAT family protein [Methanolacinia petrolearia]ADN37241.1 GCN5-related N-acetyltransferase [Methanolacinia petrolearia DSM 11571]